MRIAKSFNVITLISYKIYINIGMEIFKMVMDFLSNLKKDPVKNEYDSH